MGLPPGPLGATAFVPETQRRGERDFLPLTFPDGNRIVLSYPLELNLASLAVQPDASYFHRNDPTGLAALTFVYGRAAAGPGEVGLTAGSWTILAPVEAHVDLETIERHLRVRETTDGFPVVEALPPLELSHIFGEGGGVMLALGDLEPKANVVSSLEPLIEIADGACSAEHVEVSSSYGAKCFGDLYVGVYGHRPFIEAVLEGVRVEEL